MKYIIYNKETKEVCEILDKKPISVSNSSGVAECTAIPNCIYCLATNIKKHSETYKEIIYEFDDNGEEVAKEVEKVKEWETCDLIEDTAKSLKISIKAEINELKGKLSSTDYIVLKIAEETAYGNAETVSKLKETYATELTNRKVWRDRINELEKGV